MYIYHPNSVKLPENTSTSRRIPYPVSVKVLDKSKEDIDTIFYDVFLHPLTNKLFFIGPTLYNLKRELFPLKVYVNAKKLKLHYYQIERLFFLESEPLNDRYLDVIDINYESRLFVGKTRLYPKEVQQKFDEGNALLTISTLQKDNEVEWIGDWILWHRRLFDIKRVVLYDNGSSNVSKLTEFLSSLEPEVHIILVHWRFPHGIQPYRSAQHGSLNHCRLRFPVPNGFCINVDIDEYLVKSKEEPLLNYLNRNIRFPSPGAVVFKSRIIPNTVPIQPGRVPRCYDYNQRLSTSSDVHQRVESEKYFKYVYSYEDIGYNSPHKTRSHLNRLFCQRFSCYQKIQFFCAKTIWKVRKIFFQPSSEKPKIDSITANETDLYFFHIHGLTSGWRGQHRLKSYSQIHDSDLIPEPEIKRLAKLAGIMLSQENLE